MRDAIAETPAVDGKDQRGERLAGSGQAAAAPAGSHRPTLADRWGAFRDRLVASDRFQAWAASSPLTRWAVRRQANRLFDVCAGFVYAQVLKAVVELDLMTVLAPAPLTAPEISGRIDLGLPATERLLKAATALGLVERRSGGRYGLGLTGAALAANPGIGSMVRHHAMLYADLADPVRLLRADRSRATALSDYWAYADREHPDRLGAEQVAAYSDLMSQSQRMLSSDILAAFPFERASRVLDVGGGDGTFLEAAGRHAPALHLALFDLPAVTERARTRLHAAGFTDRTTLTGGDFFKDVLPSGADVITLVRVLFDHDEARVLSLLRNARTALAPGGTLLIAEPLSGVPGTEQITDAYYGFYLLAMGRGEMRSFVEITRLLQAAGFNHIRRLSTRRPFLTALVAASV